MRFSFLFGSFVAGLGGGLLTLSLWPAFDLAISGFFATSSGFFLRDNLFLVGLGKIAFHGARVLAMGLAFGAVIAFVGKKPLLGLQAKAFLFLLVCLLIGPGLLANVVFKDHWGRARPRDVVVFGGVKQFSPAPLMSDQCARNCSFVSGDGAFGFFLPCFAYVAPRRRSRRVFWGAMGLGVLFGGARILLGAHFASDVFYAAALSLGAGAGLHALFYGAQATGRCWKGWFSRDPLPDGA